MVSSTQSQDVLQGQAATENHAWVCDPAAGGVCVDVCVTQEALGTMQVEVRELRGPFNSLSLGKLAFPLTGYYSKQTGPCTPER